MSIEQYKEILPSFFMSDIIWGALAFTALFLICFVVSYIISRWIFFLLPFLKKEDCKGIRFWVPHSLFALLVLLADSVVTYNFTLITKVFQIYIGVSALFLIHHTLSPFIHWVQKNKLQEYSQHQAFFEFFRKTISFLIFIVGGLLIIQNLGYNVTSILAGLGIGGLAVALAAKDTLSNIFGSMVILFDRPFVVGDWIQFDKVEGTVESIGFRSTQIKTFYDSVISVPNFTIANAQIDNMGKRKFRRTRFTLGVTYSTPPEKIQSFIEGIKTIVQKHPKTKKDYYQVSFSGYADSSLNIFVNLFLQVANWNEELQFRQDIFLEILKLAQQLNVEFAFPTQSLYIEKMNNQHGS